MRAVYFTLCAVIMIVSGCNLHHTPTAEFILTETCTQQQALPLLAMADIAGDKQNATVYFEQPASFIENHADTVTIDAEQYLKAQHANSLFKYLLPNIAKRSDEDTFLNSSMLGFSNTGDTAQAQKIINGSHVLKGGPQLKWVAYQPGNVALVAFNTGAKTLNITLGDIVSTKVKSLEENFYWSALHHIKGNAKYMVTVTLKHDTAARIRTTFADDAPLLVSCTYNNKKIYCSALAGQITTGNSINEHLADEGLAFRFIEEGNKD